MSHVTVHETVLFYAFRYTLGRQTYAIGDMVKVIKEQWPNLSSLFKAKIIQEITIAIELGKAGMDMDIKQWQTILDLGE